MKTVALVDVELHLSESVRPAIGRKNVSYSFEVI